MFLQFIIPYYGSADQLIAAVSSVLYQTDTNNIGLIIVDDNHFNDEGREESTKACLFLNEHRNDGVNITYIKNDENLGVGKTRNVGLAAATAEWISFIDSDDVIDKEFVSFFREKASTKKFNTFVGKYSSSFDGHRFIDNAITWLHGKVYKLSFLRYNGIVFPPLRFNEDGGFNLMVYEMSRRIFTYEEDKILYSWNNNENSLTKKNTKKEYSAVNYIKSSTFAFGHIFKKYELNQSQRLSATIFQIYLFYIQLLYHDRPVEETEQAIYVFFNAIRKTEWYKSKKIKKSFEHLFTSKYMIEPCIGEMTIGQFIRKFEKEPINFK
jgi:glycosyltransferase involved in cell wall biosynthesis